MPKRAPKPTEREILSDIASSLGVLVEGHRERIAELESRVEALESKSRTLRQRSPLRELDGRLRDVEIKIFKLTRKLMGYPSPPASGTAADN